MVGTVPPDYDFVVTDRDPIINFFDSKTLDGDAVKVELNGRTLNNRIDLKGQSSPVPVSTDLTTGKNTLKITALNIGTVANNTVGVAFPAGTVIYDKDINGNYKSSSSGRFFMTYQRPELALNWISACLLSDLMTDILKLHNTLLIPKENLRYAQLIELMLVPDEQPIPTDTAISTGIEGQRILISKSTRHLLPSF